MTYPGIRFMGLSEDEIIFIRQVRAALQVNRLTIEDLMNSDNVRKMVIDSKKKLAVELLLEVEALEGEK